MCDRTRDRLPAFVAGTLGEAEAAAVAGHLRRCPACRAEADAWRAIAGATVRQAVARAGELPAYRSVATRSAAAASGPAETPADRAPAAPLALARAGGSGEPREGADGIRPAVAGAPDPISTDRPGRSAPWALPPRRAAWLAMAAGVAGLAIVAGTVRWAARDAASGPQAAEPAPTAVRRIADQGDGAREAPWSDGPRATAVARTGTGARRTSSGGAPDRGAGAAARPRRSKDATDLGAGAAAVARPGDPSSSGLAAAAGRPDAAREVDPAGVPTAEPTAVEAPAGSPPPPDPPDRRPGPPPVATDPGPDPTSSSPTGIPPDPQPTTAPQPTAPPPAPTEPPSPPPSPTAGVPVIAGTVHGADGAPLAGARVVAERFDFGGSSVEASTAADGRYALAVEPGRWLLRIEAEEHALMWHAGQPTPLGAGVLEVVQGTVAGVDAFLEPAAAAGVRGRVLDADGQPAGGALVLAARPDPAGGARPPSAAAYADAAGDYVLPLGPGGWLIATTRDWRAGELSWWGGDGTLARADAVPVGEGPRADGIDLRLRP